MDYKLFNEFITLVECGEFHSAAEQCNINKSVFTRHIQAMEDELGVPLFDRNTHRLELTIYGQHFLPYAHQLMDLYESCRNSLANHTQHQKSYIIEANTGAMVPYLNTISQNDRTRLIITNEGAEKLYATLRNKEIDIAIIRRLDQISRPDLREITFNNIEFAVILPHEHPLASRETVRVSDLKNEKLFVLQANQSLIQTICNEAGFEPQIKSVGYDAEFILNRVAANQGISVMIKEASYKRNAGHKVTIIPFDPPIKGKDQLVYLKSAEDSETIKYTKTILSIINEEFKKNSSSTTNHV